MLTKEQKKAQIQFASQAIKESQVVIFADFSGVSDEQAKDLKNQLREKGASMKVLKKRLLSIALKDAKIDFDTMQEKTPLAVIFSSNELTEIAAVIYKFGKQFADTEGRFDVLGAFDKEAGELVSREDFLVIAKLPSREVLLAQIMGGITGPLRAFMSIVSQLADAPTPEATDAQGRGEAVEPSKGDGAEPAEVEALTEVKPEEAPAKVAEKKEETPTEEN